jgi:hypothetical protein
MKEIPILFSTPMVQAILAGRKTQTRRIVKISDVLEYPDRFRYVGNSTTKEIYRPAIKYDDRVWHEFGLKANNAPAWVTTCPYGQPGDVLWGRETWSKIHYESVDPEPTYFFKADDKSGLTRIWKPSIHMPKVAARIWLEVEMVGVERLQDISEEDAKAEGATEGFWPQKEICHRLSYRDIWDSINGINAWEANPWVWVIKFKRIEK